MAIELCVLDGQHLEETIRRFEAYKAKEKLTLNALSTRISEQLKKNEVTKPREALDANKIFASKEYTNAKFFWKSFM